MSLGFAPAVTKTGQSLLDVRTAKENVPSRTMHNLSTRVAVRLSHTIRRMMFQTILEYARFCPFLHVFDFHGLSGGHAVHTTGR